MSAADRRSSVSARVTWSLVAVLAVATLIMGATIVLLLTYVPSMAAPSASGVAPGETAAEPTAGPEPVTETPRLEAAWLVAYPGTALVVIVVAGAFAVRWIVRRSLAPLTAMAEAARLAADSNLRARVPVGRGRDEVTDLAVTFNVMLARLDDAFAAQRRFAANASHELQTPLATTQAVLDDALADTPPGPVRDLLTDLRTLNDRSVRTVRTLLNLADAQSGACVTEPVDLAALARGEAGALRTAARERGVTIHEDIGPVVARAEPTLARLLVRNLLDNAVRHNRGDGRVDVFLRGAGTGFELRVTNTGVPLSEADVAAIVAPFHRGAGRLRGDGTGLGATLVDAIAARHGWRLSLRPGTDGGLIASVTAGGDSRPDLGNDTAPRPSRRDREPHQT